MPAKKKGEIYMKKKTKIPNFKNYKDEAKFWDSHNITDFDHETENVDLIFELNKPRDETLVVRLQKDFKVKLEKTARSKGLNVSTLARMWLMEKLQASKYKTS